MRLKTKLTSALTSALLCLGLSAVVAPVAHAAPLSSQVVASTAIMPASGIRWGSNYCTHTSSSFSSIGYHETVWFVSHYNSGGSHYHRVRVVYTTNWSWNPPRSVTNTVYTVVKCG